MAVGTGPPPSESLKGLLRCDHLDGDRGDEVVTQANSRLVLTRHLDGRGDLDLALVDRAKPGGGDGVGDVGVLDRPEESTLLAGLDRQLDLVGLKLELEVLGLLDRGVLARGAGGLDLLDLLLATAAPAHGEA